MRYIYLILVNFTWLVHCFSLETITTSVIVPCTQSHIQFLPDLLNALRNQTLCPSEVVISISGIEEKDNFQIDRLLKTTFPFSLKVLNTYKRQYAGENRNIAISNSNGDLIICQDADDIPHRSRIENIVSIYQKTRFALLLHLYLKYDDPSQGDFLEFVRDYDSLNLIQGDFDIIKLKDTKFFKLKKEFLPFFLKFTPYSERTPLVGIHFGNCAFNRKIFDKIQYSDHPTGQDLNFCSRVVERYNNCLLVNLPLVYFVKTRSTRAEREASH